jgi:hypothetical protein
MSKITLSEEKIVKTLAKYEDIYTFYDAINFVKDVLIAHGFEVEIKKYESDLYNVYEKEKRS